MKTCAVLLTSHRPETLPLAEAAMAGASLVVLEEPPHPQFADMLAGRIPDDDYLMAADYEFPAFARASLEMYRRLHAAGTVLVQCDPFMEELFAIHEFFISGGAPGDIPPGSRRSRAYAAERDWSAALLGFYSAAGAEDFGAVVRSVQAFARADAARGRLRDALRAEAIAGLAENRPDMAVEAGYIHAALPGELRRVLPPGWRVAVRRLLEPAARPLCGKGQVLGPGDVLTMLYTFRPGRESPRADLLAARALIYIKILGKDEQEAGPGEFPHTADEARCADLAARLSYADCAALYPRLHNLPKAHARALAEACLRRA
ncbi:MAG: hypothetical protein AB1916_08500 [Thermodesulfobacteriota bacterium]